MSNKECWKLEWEILRAGVTAEGWCREWHFIRYCQLMCPSFDCSSVWFQAWVWAFHDAKRNGEQLMNMAGCQSSGKTGTMCILIHAEILLWPEYSFGFFLFPQKNAAQSKLWVQAKEWAREINTAIGNGREPMIKIPEANKIRYSGSQGYRSGWIELVASDTVSQIQGTKSIDPSKGTFFVIYDECAEAKDDGRAFFTALGNIVANDNLICALACNPKNSDVGMDAEAFRPDSPGGFDDLGPDDYIWKTKVNGVYKGTAYRFSGLQSPNLHGFKVKGLFRQSNLDKSIPGTPHFNQQIAALFTSLITENCVLTEADIRRGNVKENFAWASVQKTLVNYLDPAFGGRDSAIAYTLAIGKKYNDDNSTSQVCAVVDRKAFVIRVNWKADTQFIEMASTLRAEKERGVPWVVGDEIEPKTQLAVMWGYYLKQKGVAFSDAGFDDSMRGGFVDEVRKILGSEPKVFSYNDPASDEYAEPPEYHDSGPADRRSGKRRERKAWKDVVSGFLSQVYFFGKFLIASGHFRVSDGNTLESKCSHALTQAKARRYSPLANGKIKVESKKSDEFKAAMQGLGTGSPDDADALFGACWMAKKYLSLSIEAPAAATGGNSLLRQIMKPLVRAAYGREPDYVRALDRW